MSHLTRLCAWARAVRRRAAGVHGGGRHARSRAVQPPVVRVPEAVPDWRVDVAAGRTRRWLRQGLVPEPQEWERVTVGRGVYFPPEEWALPGTEAHPRVSSEDGRGAAR
jgi:hypothetical protein